MDRRGFLKLFAGASAAAIIAPKSYFFAPQGGWRRSFEVDEYYTPESMYGLRYYQVAANTGKYLGIGRQAWPGNIIPHDKESLTAASLSYLQKVTNAAYQRIIRKDALWVLDEYPARDGSWEAAETGCRNRV